jgi:imidazole glycerol-phosphate synthase subunit HisH
MIVILDYDAGNTHSIKHACAHLGFKTVLTNDINLIKNATKLIVPGQGAFKQAMQNLKTKHLIDPIKTLIKNGVPYFGICLGFQILFNSSTEHEKINGLGILPGHITRIKAAQLKIPHMGWNSCSIKNSSMFKGINNDSYFYFVHSYCLYNTDPSTIGATTPYDSDFISAVCKQNIWGTQFHPEKSSDVGLQLLKNFLSL